VNVVAAVTGIGRKLGKFPEFAYLTAFGAMRVFAKPFLEKMLKTRIVGRELFHEFQNAVSHLSISYTLYIGVLTAYVKGIIP